jgi:1-deoxy-D-xylulose 5-phosphate reductoisomerase
VNGALSFPGIFDHVTRVMDRHRVVEQPTLEQILEADRSARHAVCD